MIKETGLHPATPAQSTGWPKGSPSGDKAGQTGQASKDPQAQEQTARRAYELFEQRGRQDGRALEDWLNAERQLAGAASR